ncbi:MAG: SDR family oxidoreductase [Verrucomicrobiota bacterium]
MTSVPDKELVWITGAGGLIGSYLVRTAPAAEFRVGGLTRAHFDLTDFDALREAFRKNPPHVVVHCAAMSKSVACQANPGLARLTNVEVTRVLADLAENIPLYFFSTDLVFDGRAGNYDESAQPNPLSVYAATKVEAEKIVLQNPRHVVIRTSLNGGTSPSGDRGFNEEMRRAWQSGKALNLFVDEFRSPIAAQVTAKAVWELIRKNGSGIFHIAGSERLSRFEIGKLVAERWPQLHPKIVPGSLRDYVGAPRSPDTTLQCAKAQALLSFPLPGLSAWLRTHPDEVF